MDKETAIKLFEDKRVRVLWDEEREKWFFSIVDVVGVLSDSIDASAYWRKLKQRLKAEGNETVTNCHGLKMKAEDGKMRLTDVADTEEILRLIQSIPSPKAEPFKMWLAKVGSERINETADPEIAIERALETYLRKGYSKEWIDQRLKTIEVRKELTDEWDSRGVQKGFEYAILTDEITKAWAGLSIKEYKNLKGLKKENLRDNMTNLELVLNMLAEASTTEISKEKQPDTFEENKTVARQGGLVANAAKKQLEETTDKKVVTGKNDKEIKKIK
ncbi:MAG: Bro-N domain-containing protein [Peptostreptococcaceae bacterium]|nr:Bro-N domain-containing protein [Peptostreptococcaceae bacterium]